MAEPTCHYCDRPAEAECATCGRLYCPEHGADVCLRCMSPESAAPPASVYRGSLLALAVASLAAIFVIVRPPSDEASTAEPRPIATNTPSFSSTATPTPTGTGPTTTIATPTPTVPVSPTVAPTPAGQTTHTVAGGDTLFGIADQYGISIDDLLAANPGLTLDSALQPGDTLIIPAQ